MINLSQIPPTEVIEEKNLVPLLQTSGCNVSERLLRLLPIIIEVLPPSLLSQYTECPAELQRMLFTLCVFHAQMVCEGLHQAPLSSLVFVLSCLYQLHAIPMNTIIDTVRNLVGESYFTVQPVHRSTSVLEGLLTSLQTGTSVLNVTDSLSIPLPSSDITPLMYCQYFVGVASQILGDSFQYRYVALINASTFCSLSSSPLSLFPLCWSSAL